MTTSHALGELPFVGDEIKNLVGALNGIRGTFVRQCSALDAAAIRRTPGPSTVTLGGLVRHPTFAEQVTFSWKLRGADPGAPWNEDHEPDRKCTSAADHPPEALLRDWRKAVANSQRALDDAVTADGPECPTVMTSEPVTGNVRRPVVHVIDEYARHTGHADLIGESIDGLVGEDPPR